MRTAASQLRAVGTAFLFKRPLIVAPGVAMAALLLVLADIPRAQLGAMACFAAPMFGLFCFEAWIGRRREVSERWLSWSLRLTVTGLSGMCAMSGGLRSPIVPLTLAPVVVAFAAFGRSRPSATMAAWFALLVVALALVPAGRPWPPIPSPFDVALTAGTSMATLVLAYVGVAQLSGALVSSRKLLLRMREEALVAATGRLESLEAVRSKVAHELKNPLASIKGLAQLSARDGEDERTRKRSEVLLTAARHMEEVLEGYLSFSRPVDDLSPEPVDLDALADEALDLADARATGGGVALRREGHGGAIVADRGRLLEALLNLVTNAVEASDAGATVRVCLQRTPDAVRLVVVDEGRGLSGADLERLGTPYFTTKQGGTGLGVVIAIAAVRQHGGEIRFEGGRGRGTTATIELPIPAAEEDAHGSRARGR